MSKDCRLFIVLYSRGGEKRIQASLGGELPVPVFQYGVRQQSKFRGGDLELVSFFNSIIVSSFLVKN